MWKWEHITMDFITKLPEKAKGFDAIWVIMNSMSKSAHVLAIQESSSAKTLSDVYVREILARCGVPVFVVSDQDVRFTSQLWKRFHKELGIRLHFITSYHLQTDGKSEQTIQMMEDMLRACVIDFGGIWDSHLPLAKFS